MTFPGAAQSVWSVGLALQVLLAVGLIAKKTWAKFRVFVAYSLFSLFETAVSYVLVYVLVHHRAAYVYVYVGGETIAVILGLGVVYEIFIHIFSLYPGLRQLAWLSLRIAVVILVVLAGAVLYAHTPIGQNGVLQAVLLMEEAARVLEVGLIAFLFVFSSLFGLHWRQTVFGITLGLGIYIVVKLLVLTMVPHVGPAAAQSLSLAQMLAFDISLLVWLGYVLMPERVASTAELPKRAQLEQWNQAIMELINQ